MSRRCAENAPERCNADDFAHAVSRTAVVQICESVGYQGFKNSALEAMTDVGIRYLEEVGKVVNLHANLSGRTQSNLFDIVRGLHDVCASVGFSGASNCCGCIVSSGLVKDIMKFVAFTQEIPFAQPVPPFPVIRAGKLIPSFSTMGETPPGKHIPTWLPAFPDPHTYVHTPMRNERVVDPRAEKIEQARQKRKAEKALLSLQQRLLHGSSTETSSSLARSHDVEGELVESKEPSPLISQEKENSSNISKEQLNSHVSVLEAFAPVIKVATEGGNIEKVVKERSFLPDKRRSVIFKFKTERKLLSDSLALILLNKEEKNTDNWLEREEERDDKKRRVEYIFKKSLENPHDLIQL